MIVIINYVRSDILIFSANELIKELFQINFTPVLILVVLLVFLSTNSLSDRKLNRQFIITIGIVFALILVDSIEYFLSTLSYPTYPRIVMSILGYTLRPIIIMNVILLVHKFKPKNLILYFIPCIIVFLVTSTALFSDIAFSYNEANEFVRGPLGFVPHLISLFYLVLTFYYSLTMYKEKSVLENVIIIALISSILFAVIIEMLLNIEGILNISIVISIAFYYLYLNVQASKRDILTGTLNRQTFYHDIERITKNLFAVISLDLNDLKKINDTLGHLSGDKLIVEFSNTVIGCLVSGCKLYRIGGDEFIVLVTKKLTMYDVEDVVNNIEKELEQKKCLCAIGIAYALDNNESFDNILKRADELMYQDKAKKKKLA